MSDPSSVVNPVSFQLNDGWRLPFDVVSGIMAASRPSTISALMKTCNTLYTEGPKHLLSDGVRLGQTFEVTTFANFMLTEDPSRFTHLRKLVLTVPSLVNSSAQARLIDLLAHPCLALETLILLHTKVFLGRRTPSPTREAFRRLKTIKHLVVLNVQEESSRAIKALPSKLESISISFDVGVGLHHFGIWSTLKPFSDTLHTMLINSDPSIPALSLLTDARAHDFPHVRTFGIVWNDSLPELLASPPFAQAFPAITHLKLIPTELPAVTHLQSGQSNRRKPELDRIARLREDLRAQKAQHRDGVVPLLSSLIECSGGLFSVYMLGLDCTLSTLRIWQSVRVGDLPILRAVLEDTRPRHLCLSTALDNVANVFATLRTLRTQAPPRIDLNISLQWRLWVSGGVSKNTKATLRSSLELLFQPLLTGLVELHLRVIVLDARVRHGEESTISEALAAFTRWASTAAPHLTLTCRFSVDADWQWPDLRQRNYDDDDDDEDDDNDYDYDNYDENQNNSGDLRAFCEQDGDEYDSDQWRRWDD
ncbi:hypothetical protein LXA43DRAFT_1099020 [Ganoderma leucocontextum]|nr:hypothetical protein LXA43DRAFT_1099020 [Ganoderma leucocontextum]